MKGALFHVAIGLAAIALVAIALVACGGAQSAGSDDGVVDRSREGEVPPARMVAADAEQIAEEGARDTLVELTPVLARIGIELEHRGDGVFRASVADGTTVDLVERVEGESVILETGGASYTIVGEDADWERASLALLSALDHVLEALGVADRAYADGLGGNEQSIAILAPADAERVNAARRAPHLLRGSR